MAEFSLIERFCKGVGQPQSTTIIGVGDDAAVVQIPANTELAISVDTMVEGVHFPVDASPKHLAHKLAAVNLSDMAAMGAQPKWATLALTMPSANEPWLAAFSKALDAILRQYELELIGGDTTSGALVLSMQIMGLLPAGKALRRSGARPGDLLYVSGTLGDAALALAGMQGREQLAARGYKQLCSALQTPQPQVELGLGLLNIANACIDISDGLVGDLEHVADSSNVSIIVDVDQVPLSPPFQHYLSLGGSLEYALSGGDDYQLAFTVDKQRQIELETLQLQLGLSLTNIGSVVNRQPQAVILHQHQQPFSLTRSAGFQHFGED